MQMCQKIQFSVQLMVLMSHQHILYLNILYKHSFVFYLVVSLVYSYLLFPFTRLQMIDV